ncbi:MAG: efflux RND transporter periplasmic adaptor subunit [Deltaproteobacteria bacterium]|nr:efflux RND transporter periplasmic adaptor subunit [Deltaproteobacteria bacterium]
MNDKIDKAKRFARFGWIVAGAALLFWLGMQFAGPAPEEASGDDSAEHAAGGGDEDTIWTCSMHPQIRMDHPGQCPICGMTLVPVNTEEGGGDSDVRIVLSERARTLARIETVTVERLGSGDADKRLLGLVEPDETLLHVVTAWTGGRIDRLRVRVTGERVRRGQVIATLYSPEIYAAHQDLISARRQVATLAGGTPLALSSAEAALSSAVQRLALLGVPDAEIERMKTATRPIRQVPIRTPYSGTVLERLATEGAYVQTGTGLYRIADLSKVWVQLDAYESDLPLLSVGQAVDLTVEGMPGRTFSGHIAFIDPVLNQQRRTARVRIEVANPGGDLRPGMFAEAIVHARALGLGETALAIPATAPLFTGRRSVVYVEVPTEERPTYEARTVRLGPKLGQIYPVLEGLSEGEHVVVHGAFTIDADLQIAGGRSMMMRPDDRQRHSVAAVTPSIELKGQLAALVTAYLDGSEALARDDLEGAKAAATQLRAAAAAVHAEGAAGPPWARLGPHFEMHGRQVAEAADITTARQGYGVLSEKLTELLTIFGNPLDTTIRVAHCPMAFGEGADWVQRGDATQNIYYGTQMPSCGDITATLPGGARLGSDGSAAPSGDATPSGDAAPSGASSGSGASSMAGMDHGAMAGMDHGASTMSTMPAAHTAPTSAADTTDDPAEAPAAVYRRQLAAVMTRYLRAERAMAGDDVDAAKSAARGMSAAIRRVSPPPARAGAWSAIRPRLASGAGAVARAGDLAAAQRAFIPLSAATTRLVRDIGNPLHSALRVAHCPMRNADWVQTGATIRNPFFGTRMPTCGSVTSTVAPMGDGQ